ncbi:hypothetical protein GCM10027047_32020 [Rhodococcus aerolatus]
MPTVTSRQPERCSWEAASAARPVVVLLLSTRTGTARSGVAVPPEVPDPPLEVPVPPAVPVPLPAVPPVPPPAAPVPGAGDAAGGLPGVLAVLPGALLPGAPDGSVLDGDALDGDAAEGSVLDGDVPDGEVVTVPVGVPSALAPEESSLLESTPTAPRTSATATRPTPAARRTGEGCPDGVLTG